MNEHYWETKAEGGSVKVIYMLYEEAVAQIVILDGLGPNANEVHVDSFTENTQHEVKFTDDYAPYYAEAFSEDKDDAGKSIIYAVLQGNEICECYDSANNTLNNFDGKVEDFFTEVLIADNLINKTTKQYRPLKLVKISSTKTGDTVEDGRQFYVYSK